MSFWGDCKINDLSQLKLDPSITNVLNECDINGVNFEAPVKGNGKAEIKSGPVIFQHPKVPNWLIKNKFNLVSLANNHIMDYGLKGFKATVDSFSDITCVGAGNWEEAYSLKTIKVNRKTVGFLSLTHCEFGTLTDTTDLENTTGAAWICHPSIPKLIQKSSEEVDFLIIMAHAGVENINIPIPEWRDIYKSFVDFGADVIIGTHPHVPQGWETYNDKPIFYSLGNFCFQKKNVNVQSYWYDSLCVILTLDDNLKLNYDVKNISYRNNLISIENDPKIIRHSKEINNKIHNSFEYTKSVNENVLSLYSSYEHLFGASGFLKIDYNKDFIIKVIKAFIRKKIFPKTHLLNNIRCESHRWAIARAIKIQNKIM